MLSGPDKTHTQRHTITGSKSKQVWEEDARRRRALKRRKINANAIFAHQRDVAMFWIERAPAAILDG
jgi:hypothetical protein